MARVRSILAAVATVAVVPVAWAGAGGAPAAAAAPLDVSSTSGAPGARVEVSADGTDDCPTYEGTGTYQRLVVRLVSGSGADAVLAAADEGRGGSHRATLVVPDWVDPARPAQIEATCVRLPAQAAETEVVATFDPVPFDVLAGAGAATQLRSFDRTTARVGEAIQIGGQGCSGGTDRSGAFVFAGGDRSGRTFGPPVLAVAATSVDPFVVDLALSDADVVIGQGEVQELANRLAPGPYTVVPACADDEGTARLYEPQVIQVSGAAPVHDVDLTVAAGTRRVTVAGGSCSGDFVDLFWLAVPRSPDATGPVGGRPDLPPVFEQVPGPVPAAPAAAGARARQAGAGPVAARAATVLPDGELVVPATGPVPDSGGAWSAQAEVGFDEGYVVAFSSCPAPDGGFRYDVQGVAIDATPAPPVPTSAVPVAPAAPAPARAVSGRPSYTG